MGTTEITCLHTHNTTLSHTHEDREKRCLEGVRPVVTIGKDLGVASNGGIQAGMRTFQESKLQSNSDLDVYLEWDSVSGIAGVNS